MAEKPIRCGDIVKHGPTGEEWLVAWADPETGDLAWCGWPNGIARISDCTLVEACDDAKHRRVLDMVLGTDGSRARMARHLYASSLSNPPDSSP